MANIFHKDFVLDDNHALPARVYADIAARDADTAFHVSTNVDKIVRITMPPNYYLLTSVGPILWAEIDNSINKNIQLNVITTPTDITADGGGIILKGTTDKKITWVDSTDSWTLNQQLDMSSNRIINVADPGNIFEAAQISFAGSGQQIHVNSTSLFVAAPTTPATHVP